MHEFDRRRRNTQDFGGYTLSEQRTGRQIPMVTLPSDRTDYASFSRGAYVEDYEDDGSPKRKPVPAPRRRMTGSSEMGSQEDARGLMANRPNSVRIQGWNGNIRLVNANPATLESDRRDNFTSPEFQDCDSADSFESALQSPVVPRRSAASRPTEFSPMSTHESNRTMLPARPPSPVEFYIKKDGQFIKLGFVDLNSLNLVENAGLARVVSTTKIQQTTATLTRETSLTDTLNCSNVSILSSAHRPSTPLPGCEDSPQQLNKWDQSPVVDKSPLVDRQRAPRFVFDAQQNADEIRPAGRLSFTREQAHNDSFTMSFRSQDVSWDQLMAQPDWLPGRSQRRRSDEVDGHRLDRRSTKECQTSFALDGPASESVPKAAFRVSSRPATVFPKDLPTYLLPLRNRYDLKVIAVLSPDMIILESPVESDEDSREAAKRHLRIDSCCRHSQFPEPFDPKRHEVMMMDHRDKMWSFGVYDGPSNRVPKQDWASVVLLSSSQACHRVTVSASELRPVPPMELLKDLPFIVASLKGIRVKKKDEVTEYLKQWQGKRVRVVTKSHRGNCNEVELFAQDEGRDFSVNQRLMLANKDWLHL